MGLQGVAAAPAGVDAAEDGLSAPGRTFPGLDRLTRLAGRVLDVPLAVVSLVEPDGQWFASVAGPLGPHAAAPFCQDVVDRAEPLYVADARPGGLGIVSYGGAPLRDPAGTVIGAFCVADRQPRVWGAGDRVTVEDFALFAQSQLAADPRLAPHDQGRAHEVTAQRRAARFRDLELGVHRTLAASADVNDVVGVLRTLSRALDGAHAELWLADDRSDDTLHPVAVWTSPAHGEPVHTPAELRCGTGVAGTVCKTGRPLWCPDLTADPAPLSAHQATTIGFGAAIAVPVRGGSHAIGALVVFASPPRPADEATLELLTGVAVHIGEFLQRRRAETLAQELNRAKDEYVALVGHELRTPLTSIAAYTELIADLPDTTPLSELRDLLGVVQRNSNQLRGIVDDLLDLAALDTNRTPPPTEPVDLSALVQDSLTTITPTAAGHDLRLDVSLVPRLYLNGSTQRLRQLIDNILANAVKYSPHGGHITVTLTDTDAAAELTITDTGIGIPDEERPHIFRRFYRSTRAREHGIPGTGLGLALCRTITDLHHGTITLNPNTPSAPTGTSITVRLPLREPPG